VSLTTEVGLAALGCAALVAACFLADLGLIMFVMIFTKQTAGLRDVAVAMRAYHVPLPRWLGGRNEPSDPGRACQLDAADESSVSDTDATVGLVTSPHADRRGNPKRVPLG